MKRIVFLFLLLVMSSFAFADLTSGNQLYYSFDNDDLSGSLPLDLTPNNNDASSNTGTTGATGIINEAFTMTSGVLTIPDDASLDITNGLTIQAWVYPTSDPTGRFYFFDKWFDGSKRSYYFGIDYRTGDRWFYGIAAADGNSGAIEESPASTNSLTLNDWNHIVMTWNATSDGKVKVYLNGVLDTTSTGSFTGNPFDNAKSPQINSFANSPAMIGRYDEVSIWSRALSSTEISELYNSGSPTTLQQYPYSTTPENFTITVTNADDLNVTLANGTKYENATGNIINTGIPINASETLTFTLESTNKFDKTFSSYTLDASLETTMSQYPQIFALDAWDNTNITEFNVTINSTLYQTTTGFIYVPYNNSWSTLGKAPDYFSNTTTIDYTPDSFEIIRLAQNKIRFNASQLFSGETVEGNFTIFNGSVNITKPSNTDFFLSSGSYDVIFTNPDYYTLTQQVNVTSLNDSTVTIEDVYNANLTVTAINLFDNTTLNNFSFTIYNENVTLNYNVSTGSQLVFPFITGVYTINANSTGFFEFEDINVTVDNGSSTYEIGFQQEGALAFFIRDIDTAALISGSNTTVTFNNATNELKFSTTTGVGSIEGLVVNKSYDVTISNSLYERAFTGFTYLQDVEQYNFYLTPNGTEININIVDVTNAAIPNALVQVETFVNGEPELVQSAFTDVRGFTRFILPVEKTYFVTVLSDNHVNVNDILINFNNPDVTIVMESLEGLLDSTGTEGVRYSLTPESTLIAINETVIFNYSISASLGDLESYSLGIYNGTDLLLYDSGSNPAGDTLNLSFDATNYSGENIRAVIKFKITGDEEQSLTRIYAVTSAIQYTGSLLELRNWMLNNLEDIDRFVIFVMAFFAAMIILAIFIKGFANVILSTLFAFIVGWVVGMSLFLLISIGAVLILGMLAWSNDIR